MFGPELMEALREFKMLWDPANRMNPGKLIDAVRVYDPAENLRHSPSQPHTALVTHFAFARDGGSLERATERCVGVGACRKTEGGVMCPSYRATGDEQHSTRGRARLLWEMLSGDLRSEGFESHAVHEALDLCLSCKACKTECPVQVDMAQYKSEFLAQRYKDKPHPLRHYVFGFADKLAKWGSITPGLTNAILNGPVTSPLIKRTIGRRCSNATCPAWLCAATSGARESALKGSGLQAVLQQATSPMGLQALWASRLPRRRSCSGRIPGTTTHHPQTLSGRGDGCSRMRASRLETPRGHICCGRPLYTTSACSMPLAAILPYVLDRDGRTEVDAGVPFIFLEPSCASVFKDELLELFPTGPLGLRAQRLSQQVLLLADWLAAESPGMGDEPAQRCEHSAFTSHCHHKAVFGGPAEAKSRCFAWLEQLSALHREAGCCQMAKPFGFEAENSRSRRSSPIGPSRPPYNPPARPLFLSPMVSVAVSKSCTAIPSPGRSLRRGVGLSL